MKFVSFSRFSLFLFILISFQSYVLLHLHSYLLTIQQQQQQQQQQNQFENENGHHHHDGQHHQVATMSFDTKPIIYLKNILSPYTSIRLSNPNMIQSYYLDIINHQPQNLTFSSEDDTEAYSKENEEEMKQVFRYFFKHYLTFHSNQRLNSSAKLLIFRPHPTGIGDRFRPFIFAYWAAVISKRIFLVDWRAPFPLSTLLETTPSLSSSFFYHDYVSQFNHTQNEHNVIVLLNTKNDRSKVIQSLNSNKQFVIMCMHNPPTDGSIYEYAFKNVPFQMKNPLKLPSITRNADFQRIFFHHVFGLSADIRKHHLEKCLQFGLKCPLLYNQNDVSKYNKPSGVEGFTGTLKNNNQSNDVVQLPQRRRPGRPGRPYIGVHARLGVGLGEGNLNRFYSLAKNILLPARCLASRAVRLSLLCGQPALPIFLATDTPDFRELFRDVVHEMSDGRVPVVFGDWEVAHTDRMHGQHKQLGFVFDKEGYPDEWKIVWGTYMDLVLLGHAEHIISIYSTFPIVAQGLGTAMSLTQLKPDVCTEKESWE